MRHLLLLALGLCSCQGALAPDAAVCRDVVHRVCIPPRCSRTATLGVDTNCEDTLLSRTGCEAADFEFTTPTRERFLECRLPLLHAGKNAETHPDCLDVDQMLNECPDVERFLQGVK